LLLFLPLLPPAVPSARADWLRPPGDEQPFRYAIGASVEGPDGMWYVGGAFEKADGFTVNNVARWDGLAWRPLGGGMNGTVRSLVFDAHGVLYAGGDFTKAGGVDALRVAKWDGVQWQPLGAGMNDTVHDLVMAPDGSLCAGGKFTTAGGRDISYVAKWDGTQWQGLATNLEDGGVSALAFGGNGVLYAGGWFKVVDPDDPGDPAPPRYVAYLSGTRWVGLGGGTDGVVLDLAVAPDGSVYVAGLFSSAGEGDGVEEANYVVRFDPDEYRSWHALGAGTNGSVSSLAFRGGMLYAAGSFNKAGGVSADGLAVWNAETETWGAVGNWQQWDHDGVWAHSVALGRGGDSGCEVFCEGLCLSAGSWRPLRNPAEKGEIYSLVVDAGGRVLTARGDGGVGIWDGRQWQTMDDPQEGGKVYALALDSHTESLVSKGLHQTLYVGGEFTVDLTDDWGESQTGYVWYSYDPLYREWSAGRDYFSGPVRHFVLHPDAAYIQNSSVDYAGGDFQNVWSKSETTEGRWLQCGTVWGAHSPGMDTPWYYFYGPVHALLSVPGVGPYVGTDDNLYQYRCPDGECYWSDLGFNGAVHALALGPDGALYAGGAFSAAGGVAAPNVALWRNSQWQALGNGPGFAVSALALGPDGALYAGGEAAAGSEVATAARWNGTQWEALENGPGFAVRFLAFRPDGTLVAGGPGGVAFWPSYKPDIRVKESDVREIHLLNGGTHDLFYKTKLGTVGTDYVEIVNAGTAPLELTGPPFIELGGAHPGDFTLTPYFSNAVVPPGGEAVFKIDFRPGAVGDRTATVSIASNDPDEPSFSFTVKGIGAAPEISLQQGTREITSGGAYAFGRVAPGQSSPATFTIRNLGNDTLTLGDIGISGDHAGDFAVTQPQAASLAPNGSTTFTVTYAPAAPGQRTATVSIASNDADENPYAFTVMGTDALLGDIDGDGDLDLADAVLALRILAGMDGEEVNLSASLKAPGRIGLDEVLYILQGAAGLR